MGLCKMKHWILKLSHGFVLSKKQRRRQYTTFYISIWNAPGKLFLRERERERERERVGERGRENGSEKECERRDREGGGRNMKTLCHTVYISQTFGTMIVYILMRRIHLIDI